jgi:flagellar biosynthesis protein
MAKKQEKPPLVPPSRRQRAVALKYEKERDEAPKVVAKGAGALAERIMAVAREHGVHIHKDSDLVEVLYKLELQETIPQALYPVIAEILAFLYKVNHKF